MRQEMRMHRRDGGAFLVRAGTESRQMERTAPAVKVWSNFKVLQLEIVHAIGGPVLTSVMQISNTQQTTCYVEERFE